MQPRTYFDSEKLKSLARSIKKIGQLKPIDVRKLDGDSKFDYELIDGERRWRAVQLIPQTTIRVIVKKSKGGEDDISYFVDSVVSNMGGEPNTPLEIAISLQRMRDAGMSVDDIADSLGRSGCWVYQHLSIMSLHPEVKKHLDPSKGDSALSFTIAQALTKLPVDVQPKACREIIKKDMSINRARAYIRKCADSEGVEVRGRRPRDYDNIVSSLEQIEDRLNTLLDLPVSAWESALKTKNLEAVQSLRLRLEMLMNSIQLVDRQLGKQADKLQAARKKMSSRFS